MILLKLLIGYNEKNITLSVIIRYQVESERFQRGLVGGVKEVYLMEPSLNPL